MSRRKRQRGEKRDRWIQETTKMSTMSTMSTKQKQVGWVVIDGDGVPRFWPVNDLAEASTYCELDTSPVPIYADERELERHEKAQAE